MLREFLREPDFPTRTPIEEVREAMRKTIALQLTSAHFDSPPKSLDEAAIRATGGNCLKASLFALWLLATPRFDRHILLSAWEQDTPRDRRTLDHAYFLVRDRGNVWYAGSPANYTVLERPEALQVHTGALGSVTENLSRYPDPSLCRWPTTEAIESVVLHASGIVPYRSDGPVFAKGNITVFELQSINSRTAGLRLSSGVQSIEYNFTPVLPAWGGRE